MISPLRRFVLMAALWLPAMFAIWFALQSPVVYLPIRLAGWGMSHWMPEVFTGMAQDFNHAVYSYVADVSGVPGLPASRLAVEEQRTNVLIYCYGLPLLYGLVLATPLNWRRTFLQLGVGYLLLSLVQTFGVVGDVLKTLALGVGPGVMAALAQMPEYAALAGAVGEAARVHMEAALALHGLTPDRIILIYQFGYLVLPAVTPVALWIMMNSKFLETLVGWREPEPEDGGPSPATDKGRSA